MLDPIMYRRHLVAAYELGDPNMLQTEYQRPSSDPVILGIKGDREDIKRLDALVALTPDDASLFNLVSSQIQRAVEVDPRECLRVTIIPGDTRTLLPVFFGSLSLGVWPTPQAGFFRVDDENFHWEPVREFHPKIASIVKLAAGIGLQHLNDGMLDGAENIAEELHYMLSVTGTKIGAYHELLRACSITKEQAPDFKAIQIPHWGNVQRAKLELPTGII